LAVVHTTFNKKHGMTFNARDGSARSVITGALLITVTGNGETLAFRPKPAQGGGHPYCTL